MEDGAGAANQYPVQYDNYIQQSVQEDMYHGQPTATFPYYPYNCTDHYVTQPALTADGDLYGETGDGHVPVPETQFPYPHFTDPGPRLPQQPPKPDYYHFDQYLHGNKNVAAGHDNQSVKNSALQQASSKHGNVNDDPTVERFHIEGGDTYQVRYTKRKQDTGTTVSQPAPESSSPPTLDQPTATRDYGHLQEKFLTTGQYSRI